MFDGGLHHLHAWITFGSASYPASRHVDFYVSALLAIAILTLLHLRPLHYGVLLPEMPGAAHVLLDGQVVPLVDKPPAQNLTRKVNLIFVKKKFTLLTVTGLSWCGECSCPWRFFFLLSLQPSSSWLPILRRTQKAKDPRELMLFSSA